MNEILMKAHELLSSHQRFVIATLTDVAGGAPQELGAKIIVTSNEIFGTIGGGKIEARVIKHARALIEREKIIRFESQSWNLQSDIGMTCGGKVTISFESYGKSQWNIVVFGAGHVSQALNRTLIALDCSITCIDQRAEWTSKLPQSPKLKAINSETPRDLVRTLPSQSFFVVMTQGHGTDLPILEQIFKHHPNAPYIGCMGSEVKAIRLRKDLLELGVSKENTLRLRTPIGLNIGGNTPEEIAISVTAELLGERSAHLNKKEPN